ncbi:MAG: Gfo/Idh/MocA family oxidoreductase [Granulicella sp.]
MLHFISTVNIFDQQRARFREDLLKKIRVAILGTGFMGRVHTEALRRLGNIEVVGVAGSSTARARAFADEVSIERATGDYREYVEDPDVDVIHICSPNEFHYEQTMASLSAGKHVLCEKPLASSVEQGREMLALAQEKDLAHCTLYNVRSYPQVQQMRQMRIADELGEIRFIQGTYSQDWLFYDTDWNWRIESGKSRTFADIGTHWCDLAEFITGLKITSMCADLEVFIKIRKRPKGPVETFQGKTLRPDQYTEVPIRTEDFGAVLFEMGGTTRGCMTASQVSVGRKNRLFMEIFGTKASVVWDAERPDELWIGHREKRSEILLKDSVLFEEGARSFADLPGGHSEGYDDTFKQTFRRFYQVVADRNAQIHYPTFEDGIRQLKLVDAAVESSNKHGWLSIEP